MWSSARLPGSVVSCLLLLRISVVLGSRTAQDFSRHDFGGPEQLKLHREELPLTFSVPASQEKPDDLPSQGVPMTLQLDTDLGDLEPVQRPARKGPDAISHLIGSTVAAAGSLYSFGKGLAGRHWNRKQKAAADLLVNAYQAQTEDGCTLLNHVARTLENKRVGLAQLVDRPAWHPIKEACVQKSVMEQLEKQLRSNLLQECEELNVPNSSASLKAAHTHCLQVAEAPGTFTDTVCGSENEYVTESLWEVELTAARIDGLMAALCDGLPGFQRNVQATSLEEAGLSVLEQQSAQKGEVSVIPAQGINPARLGLIFTLVGTSGFLKDFYASAAQFNDVYGILSDLVGQNQDHQRSVFRQSFELYWLDVAWMRSVILASMDERYRAASLPVPQHFRTLQRAESPENWYPEDVTTGSLWACHSKLKCLVPLSDDTLADKSVGVVHPGLPVCQTPVGDYRLCANPESPSSVSGLKPFAITPRKCFSSFHGGGKGSFEEDLGMQRDAWVLEFASNRHKNMSKGISNWYEEEPCLAPLRTLAESNLAEGILRKHLIEEDVDIPQTAAAPGLSESDALPSTTDPENAIDHITAFHDWDEDPSDIDWRFY